MKKKKRNKKIILVVISTLIFFLLSFFMIKDDRKLTFLEQLLKDSTLFINEIINPLKLKKNDNLEIEKRYKSEIDNLKNEINTLKESLNLNTILSDYEIINSTVINRNLGYFYDTLTLDKGENDGIKENRAVITNDGLIGKTIKVSKSTSTVKLLTSSTNKSMVSVGIKTNNNYIYGILVSYNEKENYYTIQGITEVENIKIGDSVVTSGMSDVFPSGLLIGEVLEITKDNFDLEAIIKVKPSINVNNIDYVKIDEDFVMIDDSLISFEKFLLENNIKRKRVSKNFVKKLTKIKK